MDHQGRSLDPPDFHPESRVGHPESERTGRLQERPAVLASEIPSFSSEQHVRFHQRRIDPSWISGDHRDRLLHEPLRAEPPDTAVDDDLGEARYRNRCCDAKQSGLMPYGAEAGDGRVDEDQSTYRVWVVACLEDSDMAAHRVADQDHRLAEDLLGEPVHEVRVAA